MLRINWIRLVMLSALLVGCSRAVSEQGKPLVVNDGTQIMATVVSEAPQYTIALVMKTLTNPFFVEMEKGARQAEAELGIQLVVKTGAQETSVEQQITIIRGLIAEHVDAIVVAPADSKALLPALKEAQDAGIVIVNIDNQLDLQGMQQIGLMGVPFISVDNELGAYLSAKYISDQVATPTQAIILEGIRTAKNAEDRKNGALRAFRENPNIQVVAQETAHWKIDEAHDVVKGLLEQYPNVQVIFCANDMMAFGVIEYLDEVGRTDVLVAAYDALDEALEFLRNGKLQATIDQQAALQGYTGVQFALRMHQGETVPAEVLVDVKLVTAKTLE
ncbi:MAG: sugar ABC transporter substrate-binding protein [Anaerolineae bacterium]|nr:sugar ABC transporter substrate-binding protein [Anaerolineae bacterium]